MVRKHETVTTPLENQTYKFLVHCITCYWEGRYKTQSEAKEGEASHQKNHGY